MTRQARFLALLPALLAIASTPACGAAPTSERPIDTLAKVKLATRADTPIRFGSLLRRGKPTLVSIWASWCPPCVVEAPHLDRIRKRFGTNLTFLYVNRRNGDPDPLQPQAEIDRFLSRGGLADVDYVVAGETAYRQIVGADMRDIPEGKIGLPRVYLFDRAGRQVYTAYGFGDGDGEKLERLVAQAVAL